MVNMYGFINYFIFVNSIVLDRVHFFGRHVSALSDGYILTDAQLAFAIEMTTLCRGRRMQSTAR